MPEEVQSNPEVPHYNVVFCTPGANFTAGYLQSILMTVYALNNEGLSWFFLNSSSSHVAVAREGTIAGAAKWGTGEVTKPMNGDFTYDKLMWIDSDIQWTPQDFARLYYSDKDIVSGCYLMMDRSTPIYQNVLSPMMREEDLLRYDAPFKTNGVGFGFLCVKSGVFEAISRPWFSLVGTDSQFGMEVILGEDLAWCIKAKNAGFDIWVDPAVKVSHHKTGKVSW
jgi:hypothetical protein